MSRGAYKAPEFDLAQMLRVPFGAGPPHVVKLGPIGIADPDDQSLPSRPDRIQAATNRDA